MSTNESDIGGGGMDPNAPQLSLQSVYLKDCSYEAPNGPRVQGEWNPQINLDLHTGVNPLGTDVSDERTPPCCPLNMRGSSVELGASFPG